MTRQNKLLLDKIEAGADLARMLSLKPNDKFGREIVIGDWVRLVQLPTNISALPRNTQHLFREALGKTFKIKAFGKCGHAELVLSRQPPIRERIWVEPACLELSLYSAKKSGKFGPNLYIPTI
jgi:hypothetical protein